jgi:hypothetical protein
MESIIVEFQEPKKRGRPIALIRKTDDPQYFTNYYKTKLTSIVECEFCKSKLTQCKLKRHQQTPKCLRLAGHGSVVI